MPKSPHSQSSNTNSNKASPSPKQKRKPPPNNHHPPTTITLPDPTVSSKAYIASSNYAGRKSLLNQPPQPNPLTSFPRRQDPVSQLWLLRSENELIDEYEKSKPYLLPFKQKLYDKTPGVIVPDSVFAQSGDFGVIGHTREAGVKRAFREVQANGMFEVMDYDPTAEPELEVGEVARRANGYREAPPTKKATMFNSNGNDKSDSYVLLRRAELSELTSLERLLKKERLLLRQQCSWLFSSQSGSDMSTRLPRPVALMAVRDVCLAEMREARCLLVIVLRIETKKGKDEVINGGGFGDKKKGLKALAITNDTNRGGNSTFDRIRKVKELSESMAGTYVNNQTKWPSHTLDQTALEKVPVKARGSWYIRQLEEAREKLRVFECNAMLMEETVQRLSWRYLEAKSRMDDYQHYYNFAVRYGPFGEDEFNDLTMPGTEYLSRVTNAALSWQRMWWAIYPGWKRIKIKRALKIQSMSRGYLSRRRWRPIIRMRFLHGKGGIMRNCFKPWKVWCTKRIKTKALLRSILQSSLRLTFTSWKGFCDVIRNTRVDKGTKFLKRLMMQLEYKVFSNWNVFVVRKKKIFMMMKRVIGGPSFYNWMDFVKMRRYEHMGERGMVKIQAFKRGWKARDAMKRLRKFMGVLRGLVQVKVGMNFVKRSVRDVVEMAERAKVDSEVNEAIGVEQRRLDEFTVEFEKKERLVRKVKNKYLKSRKGKKEMKTLATKILNDEQSSSQSSSLVITKKSSEETSRARLLTAAVIIARTQHRHDFDSLTPPKIKSADYYKNPQVFVSSEHYLKACPEFADIHLCMLDSIGLPLFESYVNKMHGMTSPKFMLNFILAVQDWRKTKVDSLAYVTCARLIYKNYLAVNSPQMIPLNDALRDTLEVNYQGFNEHAMKADEVSDKWKSGILAKVKIAFSFSKRLTNVSLTADIFDEVTFECILQLRRDDWFDFLRNDLGKQWIRLRDERSNTITQSSILAFMSKRKTSQLIEAKDIKTKLIAHAIITIERKKVQALAEDIYIAFEIERMIMEAIDAEVTDCENIKHVNERVKMVEIENMTNLFMKECEMIVIDDVINKKVDLLADERILLLRAKKSVEAVEQFIDPFIEIYITNLITREINREIGQPEKSEGECAIMIQKRVRGLTTRVNLRKMLATRFSKQYDDASRSYYWRDKATERTSYDKPLIFKVLFRNVGGEKRKERKPPPKGPPVWHGGQGRGQGQGHARLMM